MIIYKMSFLCEIQNKKKKLKSCETVVTSVTGCKFLEKKSETGELESVKLMDKSSGFVVDEKLDLQIAQILNYLYLSSQDVAQDFLLLQQNGITHVLSVGVDLSKINTSSSVKFKTVALLDEPESDITKVLDECFDFIENSQLENNHKVLVHCNAGYSRAPTIVIGYLMKKFGYSLSESFDLVKQKRNIKPNPGFMEQLKKLETNLKTNFSYSI